LFCFAQKRPIGQQSKIMTILQTKGAKYAEITRQIDQKSPIIALFVAFA
jgi:hypothetical protein